MQTLTPARPRLELPFCGVCVLFRSVSLDICFSGTELIDSRPVCCGDLSQCVGTDHSVWHRLYKHSLHVSIKI